MGEFNYNQLMSFREIATSSSLSKAAQKLRIGQPAVSSQLKKLETSLGFQLFNRNNRRLALTEKGRFVLQCANDVHLSGSHLLDSLKQGMHTSKSVLNIGAFGSVPKHLLLQLIHDARKSAECRVTIREGDAHELLQELDAHTLDLLITNHHPPVAARGGLHSRLLAKVAIAVFAAPGFKSLRRGFPRSVSGQSFILPTVQNKLRHDVEDYFRTHAIEPDVIVQTQDTSMQKLLGQEGRGLIVLPEFSADELVGENKLVKLGLMEGVYEEFWLISAKRTLVNPVSDRLMREFAFAFVRKAKKGLVAPFAISNRNVVKG